MGLIDVVFGRPLASSEDAGQRITATQGIPTFGLDALSSAAYGPEAALTILLPLGLVGIRYVVPLTFAVIALLTIVYFQLSADDRGVSEWRGIVHGCARKPGQRGWVAGGRGADDRLPAECGGGDFGGNWSAGIGSAFVAAAHVGSVFGGAGSVDVVNLRGVKEAGSAFIAPTYLFVGTLVVVIAVGLYKVIVSGGHPVAVAAAAQAPVGLQAVGVWILVKAFASGCTALTEWRR